jgi:hypothetical protein
MVVLTDTVDWTEMEARAEKIRAKKLKKDRTKVRFEVPWATKASGWTAVA